MEEHQQPRWWSNIVKDLKRACESSKKSFIAPYVIIGTTEEKGTDKISGYIIRLPGGEAGYYPTKLMGKAPIPVGSRIKKGAELPEPEYLMIEPARHLFVFKTTRDQVKLLSKPWLLTTIINIINGRQDSVTGYDKEFDKWLKLPQEAKVDDSKIQEIKRSVEQQGLRGLARYNNLI